MHFICSTCKAVFTDILQHAHHQKAHAADHNFLFSCGSCVLQFNAFRHLCSHISKCHKRSTLASALAGPSGLKCSYCAVCPQTVVLLIKHLRSEHLAKGTHIMCPLKECGRSEVLISESTFSKHLSQHHKGWQGMSLQEASVPQVEARDSDFGGDEVCGESNFEDDIVLEDIYYDGDSSDNHDEKDILNFISKFYLKLETELHLPVAKIEKISDSVTLLSEMTMSYMKKTVVSELMALNLPQPKVEDIVCKLVDSNILFLSHHRNMRGPSYNSEHLRRNVFMASPNFVPPQPCDLSEDHCDPEIYQYVPLKKTLQKLLIDPSLQREVEKSFVRFEAAQSNSAQGTVYHDYTDGSVCKRRSLPSKRLDLIMFQDGFAATTMITTTRNKHKTLGVYATLGNLRPFLRTKLKAMQMVMLVLEEQVKRYRQKCFAHLLKELQDLETNGIEFKSEQIPVYLQFFTGDSLGQHFLGGFVEAFSSGYVCRYCPITVKQFREDPTALKPFRTQADYNRSVFFVESTGKNNHQGIKESSVFNKLENFKVCDPSLPPCLGHDLFHGVVSWDLASMIEHFVQKNWFSYETINRRIADYAYASMDLKNKPAPVKNDGMKLGGSAVQNWTLLRLLSFIIEGKINDPNDAHWKLYLKLKSACEYICAPSISEEQVQELDILVESYLSERNILIFNRIRPKHHYFRHYPALIRKFGPLIHLWGMRFEQKHQFFKSLARSCMNFKNLLYTFAMRHQLLFTYQSEGERFPEYISKCKPFKVPSNYFTEDVVAFVESQSFSPSLQAASSIKINNLTYKEGNWIIQSQTSRTQINIGIIEAIILDQNQVFFIHRQKMATLKESTGLFEIDEESNGQLVIQEYNSIQHPCPQCAYDFGDTVCFSLKSTFPLQSEL